MTPRASLTTSDASTNLVDAVRTELKLMIALYRPLYTPQLERLNSLLADTDNDEYVQLVLPNRLGADAFVWDFKRPVFDALLDLFNGGELSVSFIDSKQHHHAALMACEHARGLCDLPLLSDNCQFKSTTQHWIIMRVRVGTNSGGGHWYRPIGSLDSSVYSFHRNNRECDACALHSSHSDSE